MIDPAPLAHEPSDTEIARRIALLDLPAADPRRLWEPFTRHLDHPTALTTTLLQHWLDRPVHPVELLTREQRGRQYRVVSLVTTVDGEQVPLCHASAVVDLALLPEWARDVLTRTEHPLARVMHLAGAVRERTAAEVLDPDPEAPGDAGLRIRGAFRLPGNGGRMAARIEEWFTGYALQLHESAFPVPGAAPQHRPDDVDEALLRILRRRHALATAGIQSQPAAPYDAHSAEGTGAHLPSQLVRLLQRGGEPPAPLPGRADGGEPAGRQGA
jgi:chorismate-pyruvate lyase